MTATPAPAVRRHHWIVRLTHWATVIVLAGLIASGLQIYEAYARFGNRGGPYFVSPFDGAQFPHWSRLGGWLAGALNWHFALAWPLVAFGLLYLGYLVRSGEWRALVFQPRDVRGALEMGKYYLHLRREHPPQGKHNPLQKLAYTGVIGLGALAVLTGFAIYKPTQLAWLTALFGGFQAARYWHFWIVWIFVGFTIMHVILVFAVDPASLRAIDAQCRPAGVREARHRCRRRDSRRGMRLGRRTPAAARAARHQSRERLGWRENPVLAHAPRSDVQRG